MDCFVTSEQFFAMANQPSSITIKERISQSTIYCDLDLMTQNTSIHDFQPLNLSSTSVIRYMDERSKSNKYPNRAVVQKIAAEIYRNSIEPNVKHHKRQPKTVISNLSSEILLRDDDEERKLNNLYFQKALLNQKYDTNPLTYVERSRYAKGTLRNKRNNNCPCKILSHQCPCISNECKKECETYSTATKNHSKKYKKGQYKDTNEVKRSNVEHHHHHHYHHGCNKVKMDDTKNLNNVSEPYCANSPERTEISCSVLEDNDENNTKLNNIKTHPLKKEILQTAMAYRVLHHRNIEKESSDNETNKTEVEVIPILQMPSKKVNGKSNRPRVIRISKACRHQPPCAVIPSCQKIYSLENKMPNNYIPICNHKPRCINVPLCSPISKLYRCDDISSQFESSNNSEFVKSSVCTNKWQSSKENKCRDRYHHYTTSAYVKVENSNFSENIMKDSTNKDKSSQFDAPISSQGKNLKECVSDAIVFIRDVGCQFRNKQSSVNVSIVTTNISSSSLSELRASEFFKEKLFIDKQKNDTKNNRQCNNYAVENTKKPVIVSYIRPDNELKYSSSQTMDYYSTSVSTLSKQRRHRYSKYKIAKLYSKKQRRRLNI